MTLKYLRGVLAAAQWTVLALLLATTLLDIAGATHPSKNAVALAPITGKSLVPLLAAGADAVRTENVWLGWEFFGNRAIRQGDWKLMLILKGAGRTSDDIFAFLDAWFAADGECGA